MINAFQEILDTAGQTVLINDKERVIVVTNPPLNEYEERNIHSLENVSQGDLVKIDNEKYLVITESITQRGGKYKVRIRHCNHDIEIKNYKKELIGHSEFGEPIYEEIYVDSTYIPSIIDNKSFSIDSSAAIRVPENQIISILQDNTYNREKFQLNNTFTFEEVYVYGIIKM
ncbi:hypothetical protein [Cytobacillus pseudoceanisediminis]